MTHCGKCNLDGVLLVKTIREYMPLLERSQSSESEWHNVESSNLEYGPIRKSKPGKARPSHVLPSVSCVNVVCCGAIDDGTWVGGH